MYVRVRGKTQGPYTTEQLQQLASRGQLSRLHEVSLDGVEWKRAGTVRELFASEGPRRDESRDFFDEPAPPSATGGEYFLRVRGHTVGPYTEEYLRSLARKGQFSRLHEISIDGISWVRASTVPSLFPEPGDRSNADPTLAVQAAPKSAPLQPTITLSDDGDPTENALLSVSEPLAGVPHAPRESSIPWSWIILAVLIAISVAAAAAALIVWLRPDLVS